MKRLLFILLLLPVIAFGQSTTTLPTSTAYTPQFRYTSTAADTLKQLWVYSGAKWNRIYTATEINQSFIYTASSGITKTGTNFTLNQAFTRGLFSGTGSLTYNSTTGAFSAPTNVSAFTNDAGYVPQTRSINTGNGLSGGGNLSGDRTLTADTSILQTKANSNSRAQADARYVPITPTTDGTLNIGSNSNRYGTGFFAALRTTVLRQANANDFQIQDNNGVQSLRIFNSTRNVVIGTATTDNGNKFTVGSFLVNASGNALLAPNSIYQSSTGTTADSLSFVSAQKHVSKVLATGNGISIVQTASAVTISATGNPIVEITGTSQTASGNTIYIPHNAALTTITVPTTTTIGTLYQVIGEGAGGWKLQLPAGYTAVGVGSFTTTSGGSLNSTDRNCTITIRLTNTNKFTVTTSQGTINPL